MAVKKTREDMTDDAIQCLIGDTDTATSKVTLSNSVYTARKKYLVARKMNILLKFLDYSGSRNFSLQEGRGSRKNIALAIFLHKFFSNSAVFRFWQQHSRLAYL
jgi:hypothetical protein